MKTQKFRAQLWLSENYPLSLPEQLVPIIDLMAATNAHFRKLKDFITLQLPAGFPVKIGQFCVCCSLLSNYWVISMCVFVSAQMLPVSTFTYRVNIIHLKEVCNHFQHFSPFAFVQLTFHLIFSCSKCSDI